MTWIDALLITAMGMGVTFLGLLLTQAAINAFNFLPGDVRPSENQPATATPVPPSAETKAPSPAMSPETLAAIVAVLSVEIRFYRSYQASRFTFNSAEQRQGWSVGGRLIVNPYQRGKI